MTESKKKSVTVWEPGTGGQDVERRSLRSHFPHDEMDSVPNSRSVALTDTEGGMMFNWSRLWLWAATLHGDRESRRQLRLPQEAQPICEPLLFRLRG